MTDKPAGHARKALSWLLLVGWLAAPPALAQVDLFVDSDQNLGFASSTAVALGDLDGDSDLDAFVANYDAPNRVWINQGGAQGGVPGSYLDSGQALGPGIDNAALDVALGDLDGDNDLDAFVVHDGAANSNRVWSNQGGAQHWGRTSTAPTASPSPWLTAPRSPRPPPSTSRCNRSTTRQPLTRRRWRPTRTRRW